MIIIASIAAGVTLGVYDWIDRGCQGSKASTAE
jgi:hypothetical protein